MKFLVSLAAVLLLAVPVQAQSCYSQALQSQSCYSQAYSAPVQAPLTAFCGAQTQIETHVLTIRVPVAVAVEQQPVAVAVAAPCAAQAVAYAAPQQCVSAQQFGFSAGYGYNQGFVNQGFANHGFVNSGFVNRGFVNTGFVNRGFGAPSIVSGTGVVLTAADRRGNTVQAVGANNVRVQRGLLGRINGATVDQPRGILNRLGL